MAQTGTGVFPLHNGKAPPDEEGSRIGPRALRIPAVIVGGTPLEINIIDELAGEQIATVQTLFVDNSDGSNAVTIQCSATGQRLKVGAGKQAYLPFLLAINDGLITISRADSGTLPLFFINVPMPAIVW